MNFVNHMYVMPETKKLSPADLSGYAELQGWTRGAPYGDNSHIYVSNDQMIVLPHSDDAPDYLALVDHAVQIFADIAGTDQRRMYDEIKWIDRDAIRIRAIDDDTENGSVDLKRGRLLIENIWQVLKTLAEDIRVPTGFKKGAESLLEGFRLEQTELGSYTAVITTPPIPRVNQGQALRPPHRHLSQCMADRLDTTRALADVGEASRLDSDGLSQLSPAWCDKLADLIQPFEEVHFGVAWARTSPMRRTVDAAFNREGDVPFLRESAEVMQSDEAAEEYYNVNLPGYVEALKHPKPINSVRTVTIKGTFKASNLTANAVLQPDDYSLALRANETKSNVIVSAERMFKKGRSWQLEGARILKVIPSVAPDTTSDQQGAFSDMRAQAGQTG